MRHTADRFLAVFVAACTVSCTTAIEEQSVSEVYTEPRWTSSHEFASIVGFRLLSDGRMIVSDVRDKTVVLLDSTGQLLATIGRQGSGPGEYIEPRHLRPLPGDSTLLVDPSQRRFLVFAPNGAFVRGEPFPTAIALHASYRLRTNESGEYLVETTPDPTSEADSAWILRYSPSRKAVDTITTIRIREFGPAQQLTRGGVTYMGWMLVPHSHRDEWIALPRGGIAVVRSADFSVEVYGAQDTTRVRRTIAYTPVAVTAAELDKVDESLRSRVPKFKQPFFAEYTVRGADDEVWTRLTMADSLALSEWEVTNVVTRTGSRVTLPRRSEVLAATASKIYTVQYDEDDVPRIAIFAR